jgi:CRISPR/Cas system-associated exonuclease Cas4 (RecB family)
MAKDKFTAIWVSHSSIGDYLKCPRLYYLRNMYRDPKTNHKISLMQPSLALGQIVHDTVDEVSHLPAEERFKDSLLGIFEKKWETVHGKLGGFKTNEDEEKMKRKGVAMIERVMKYPGPLKNKAIKIRQELPYYWVSEEENIILCGKIDWLEFIEETQSVHIIDFKTGKYDEDPDSLQLPIYYLSVTHCQKWPVTKLSYWYLDRDTEPYEVDLPKSEDAEKRVMELAKKIALARKLEHLPCPKKEGCRFCRPYESIIQGKAERVGTNLYGQDLYILNE